MIGVAGLLLLAKSQGLIPNVREPLLQLRQANFRIGDSVFDQVLAAAGES